ncbi:immunoglobulin Y heavy chain constant region [Pelobates cultripes]|nr:immunoglobulin Y heavy chain constant region [Pelobates cultripes]
MARDYSREINRVQYGALCITAEKTAPSVFPLRPCCGSESSGTHVSIGCLVSDYFPTPVNVQWNSGSITSGIKNFPAVYSNGRFTSSTQLIIPVSDWESKKYVCNVEHPTTSTKVSKEIEECSTKENPPKVEVLQGSCGDEPGNNSVELVCLIYGYSPKDIKVQWLLNGKATSISPTNSTPFKNEEGTFESRSKVQVPKQDWNSGDVYTCKVVHDATKTREEAKISKCKESASGYHPKIVVHPPSPKDLLVTKEPKLICEVSKMENPDSLTGISWVRSDGKRNLAFTSIPEKQDDGTYTVQSRLKISVQDWNSNKEFSCTAAHIDLPSPVTKTIKKGDNIREPTVYIYPPAPEELNSHDFVNLPCLIKGFFPGEIYVQWKKDGVIEKEDYYLNTTPVEEDEEDFFIFSKLIISKSDWIKGVTYSCIAAHDTIIEKTIKKSRGK